jgi:hypothetical protein
VLPAAAQSTSSIDLDPAITQEDFTKFSRIVAQSIYATPVEPARARGILGFDIGLAATAVPVDTDSSYWQDAVGDDFTFSDHVVAPRIVVSKGLSLVTISGMYLKVADTDVEAWGGALDVPVMDGGLVKPTLALRGSYAQLNGVNNLDLKTYGVELFLSKGFGPVTPYGAIGFARSDSTAHFDPIGTAAPVTLSDDSNSQRITLGVRFSLLIPKFVVEATQGEERSYAAKVSFGL